MVDCCFKEETAMDDLKRIVIQRLENRGIERQLIPGFIRSLANSFACDVHPNLDQVNDRLNYMGWDGYELDYHTFELVSTCLENEGIKQTEYIPSKWLERTFAQHSRGMLPSDA